jgi:hypothetical protein
VHSLHEHVGGQDGVVSARIDHRGVVTDPHGHSWGLARQQLADGAHQLVFGNHRFRPQRSGQR